jgi:hypothetical protein
MAQHFKRTRPARGVLECENLPTLIFLTVCSKDRRKWLANPTVHRLLREVWREENRWRVGPYVLMLVHRLLNPLGFAAGQL